jgi:hypothetical protein
MTLGVEQKPNATAATTNHCLQQSHPCRALILAWQALLEGEAQAPDKSTIIKLGMLFYIVLICS